MYQSCMVSKLPIMWKQSIAIVYDRREIARGGAAENMRRGDWRATGADLDPVALRLARSREIAREIRLGHYREERGMTIIPPIFLQYIVYSNYMVRILCAAARKLHGKLRSTEEGVRHTARIPFSAEELPRRWRPTTSSTWSGSSTATSRRITSSAVR